MSPRNIIQLARPWQWSKNGIIFAGLIFSLNLLDASYLLRSVQAFAVFCLASSAIYVLNDVFDIDRDRLHPKKKHRPLASGQVSRSRGMVLSLLLAAASVALGYGLGGEFLLVLAVFLIVNASYSIHLRNVVILDVLLIAVSFVVRAIAGVVALRPLNPDLELSPWLLVCTLFLALFLALGKRRHELALLESDAVDHRSSLGEYSREFLDQLMAIVTSSTLIAYAIYTIAPGTLSKFHSPSLVFTIPFVVYGVFRYLFLVETRNQGGNPSRLLYRDLPILVTLVGWLLSVVVILYADRF